jgi:adenylylsulfate kinase-like enzyme
MLRFNSGSIIYTMSAHKITLTKPVLICLYGFPGSGKSYVSRNLNEVVQIAHVSGDRIRSELFENPRYDAQENAIVRLSGDFGKTHFYYAKKCRSKPLVSNGFN